MRCWSRRNHIREKNFGDRKVVPGVPAGDVVQVGLLQELLPVSSVADPCQKEEGADCSQDQPKTGRVGPEPVDEPAGRLVVRQGHVHWQAVHDWVDFKVHRHSQGDSRQKVHSFLAYRKQ